MFIFFKENGESLLSKGRKRTAPRGRGRGSAQSKRGRKSDNSAVQRTFLSRDDDDSDDEDNARKLLNKSQPRVSIFIHFLFHGEEIVKYSFFTCRLAVVCERLILRLHMVKKFLLPRGLSLNIPASHVK